MSKKVKTTSSVQTEKEIDHSKFTHTAISVYKDKSTGKWMLAEIVYDPITRESVMLPSTISAETRDFIIEKFKKAAIDMNIIG